MPLLGAQLHRERAPDACRQGRASALKTHDSSTWSSIDRWVNCCYGTEAEHHISYAPLTSVLHIVKSIYPLFHTFGMLHGTFQAELPKVSVREIQVKQVDRNIAHLRANQEIVSVAGSGGR